jgi:uncharacterized protein with HEPN domain
MISRDPKAVRDMLNHATEAVAMASERSRDDLDTDRMFELALVHLVEIVGEAATRVSEEGRSRWPTIPWASARRMRNRLIHGYDSVDLNVLWDTIEVDFPPLIEALSKIVEKAYD